MVYKAGINGRILKVLQSLYQRVNTKIKLDHNKKSNKIEATHGIIQNDTLSPLLFSLLLNDITEYFKEDT